MEEKIKFVRLAGDALAYIDQRARELGMSRSAATRMCILQNKKQEAKQDVTPSA